MTTGTLSLKRTSKRVESIRKKRKPNHFRQLDELKTLPVFKKKRPLKIGIHKDIKARYPRIAIRAIYSWLYHWTNRPKYKESLKRGGYRYDLNDQPTEVISNTHILSAKGQLSLPDMVGVDAQSLERNEG